MSGQPRPNLHDERPRDSALSLMAARLSSEALADLLAEALRPSVATDAAWSELLALISPRELQIAANDDYIEGVITRNDEREDSPRFTERMALFQEALNEAGPDGDTARARFARTFGSREWLGAMSNDYFFEFAKAVVPRQTPIAANALAELARAWVDESMGLIETSRAWGREMAENALQECARLGLGDRILQGELLAEVDARFSRDCKSPQVKAMIEAAALGEQLRQAPDLQATLSPPRKARTL